MPIFEIETSEEVHGIYLVQAESEVEARKMWTEGLVTKPTVYEATYAKISVITLQLEYNVN